MKKTLAVLLLVALIVACMPIAALADSQTAEKLAPGVFAANLRLQGLAYDAKGEENLAMQAFQAYLAKNPKGDVPEKYAAALVGQ